MPLINNRQSGNQQMIRPEGLDIKPKDIESDGKKGVKNGEVKIVDETLWSPFQQMRSKQLAKYSSELSDQYLRMVQPIRRSVEENLFYLKYYDLSPRKQAACRNAVLNGIKEIKNFEERFLSMINQARAGYDVQIQLYYKTALKTLGGPDKPLKIKRIECDLDLSMFDTTAYESELGGMK